MTALTAGRNTPELAGENPAAQFVILAAEIMYAGDMAARTYDNEVQMAADTLGFRVEGRVAKTVDNTADGKSVTVERGIFRYENSATYPVGRAQIGRPCYVEDDNTVAAYSTNLVAAGLVVDVDSDGVWVDQRVAALELARRLALPKVVAVAAATATVSAAQCFQGNVVLACDYATGVTLTLPAAQAGYRVGVQRTDATAAHDVVITAATGDTVRGSTAGGTASNTTDAVSQVLYLEAVNGTAWVDADPLAADRAVWAPST